MERKVIAQSCPLLVPLVEEGWVEKTETKRILRSYLGPLRRHQVDNMILGCTHYPFLKKHIAAIMGRRVRIIDSAESVVNELLSHVVTPLELGNQKLCFTDDAPHTRKLILGWLHQNIPIERVTL